MSKRRKNIYNITTFWFKNTHLNIKEKKTRRKREENKKKKRKKKKKEHVLTLKSFTFSDEKKE